MKILRFASIWLVLFTLFSCCNAELIHDYEAYYSQMLLSVQYGDFREVTATYESICSIWPNATDRKGDTDNLAVYAYARVAMEEKAYNDACRLFAALPAEFGSEYSQINADLLMKYCQAQRFLVYGYTDEALAKFMQCNGTLDSSQMISRLLDGQEEMLIGLRAILIESNAITMRWTDMASDNDEYVITCMPKGSESRTKTLQCQSTMANIDGLIPETCYTVYVTPYKKGVVNGKTISAEYTTIAGNEGNRFVRKDKLEVYSYDVRTKMAVNSVIGTEDYFLKRFLNSTSGTSILLEEGKSMYMPFSDMSIAETGFILRCTLRCASNVKSTNVKIVLRPANGGSYDYDRTVDIEGITGIGGFCIYLDEILQDVYTDNNGWPYGIMFIDVYADNAHIARTQYKMDTVG